MQVASGLLLVRILDLPPGKAPCLVLCWAAATFSAPWLSAAGAPAVFVTLALRGQPVPLPVDALPASGRGWRLPGVLLGAEPAAAMPLVRNSLVLPVLGRLSLPLVPGALHSAVRVVLARSATLCWSALGPADAPQAVCRLSPGWLLMACRTTCCVART